MIVELVEARGHPNVRAKHRTTIEVTTENYLTPRGDCIVGVNADKAAADLDRRFVEQLRNGSLTAIFVASGEAQVVRARGVPSLTSTNESKLIIRRSQYVESATVGVEADRSAGDLDRRFVEQLRKGVRLYLMLVAAERTLVDEEILRVICDHLPSSGGFPVKDKCYG